MLAGQTSSDAPPLHTRCNRNAGKNTLRTSRNHHRNSAKKLAAAGGLRIDLLDNLMALPPLREEEYSFAPNERAVLAGGPASPFQPIWRRPICAFVGILTGLAGGLGNGLITVNAPYLLGSLGLESNEMAWLPTVYSMTYISMNLLLVRFRQQFGLRLFSMLALSSFCAVMLLHLVINGLGGAILIHAAAGVAAAPMTAISVYYLMSAFPPKKALAGAILGLGISQIPIPLARLFSSDLLGVNQWQSLYLFEFGLAAVCLGCVGLVRLPPSDRQPAFERLDFISFPFFAVGAALLCAVLGMGRNMWWTDSERLGCALAAAIPLLGVGFYIEGQRQRPLLDLRWLATPDLLRFVVVASICRIVLAEQSTSAIGLLSTLGVANEELHYFSFLLVLASVAGAVFAAIVFTPARLTSLGALALGLVAIGSLLDCHSSNLTRPEQLYFSQMLIAFAATVFIGPALLFGITFVLVQKGRTLASLLVLFVVIQNLGSLAGSALLSSFQIVREKANSLIVFQHLTLLDPQVAQRLQGTGGALAHTLPDSGARYAQSLALLHRQSAREAAILAYNNSFALVAGLSAATTLYLVAMIVRHWWRGEPLSSAAIAMTPRSPA